jgi:hypothetical protein
MVALAKPRQTAIGGLDSEQDRVNEAGATYVWREQIWAAMTSFVESYIDAENGLKKHDGVAFRLNQIWEEKGRPVTGGALKNALKDENRNNFRLEWSFWFASQDEEIARLLGCKTKPNKTAEQLNADWEAVIRETFSHREAEKLIRKVKAR